MGYHRTGSGLCLVAIAILAGLLLPRSGVRGASLGGGTRIRIASFRRAQHSVSSAFASYNTESRPCDEVAGSVRHISTAFVHHLRRRTWYSQTVSSYACRRADVRDLWHLSTTSGRGFTGVSICSNGLRAPPSCNVFLLFDLSSQLV